MRLRFFALLSTAFVQIAVPFASFAEDPKGSQQALEAPPQEVRARFQSQENSPSSETTIEPEIKLLGGSTLKIVTHARWAGIAEKIQETLELAHVRYTSLFGEIPQFESSVRLMDEESFYLSTGAPRWTNALYYRGQIMIPISLKENIDSQNLLRSVKHEFTHAVLHALSGGECPGWLDEGIAQLAEGHEHPRLRPALAMWLQENDPVPFSLLRNGFTKLNVSMVPAAYAQSLMASEVLLTRYGFSRVGNFLQKLREGDDEEEAFRKSFLLSLPNFERQFGARVQRWSKDSSKMHDHS